jgi:LytS/YehU family sensor histidine kinase
MGIGMLLVVYFAFREHELAAAKAAQDANTQRATVERATVAARLKVMQARVEPELLFGALSDVRELYLRDRHAAEALLDDLIAYLRAALPQMRSDSSSLGREATLAVAYARVLPAARRGDLAASSDIPDDTKDLPFPPMVLLPLVRAAAQSPVSRISIESGGTPVSGATVRVEPAQHPAGWDDAGLEGVRAALAHAFGAEARLDVQGDRVVVRWPANARE